MSAMDQFNVACEAGRKKATAMRRVVNNFRGLLEIRPLIVNRIQGLDIQIEEIEREASKFHAYHYTGALELYYKRSSLRLLNADIQATLDDIVGLLDM
jgi:hypothetical protein